MAAVGLSALVAFICAVGNSGVIGGWPPKLRPNHLQIAAATGHVNVDLPSFMPSLVHARAEPPHDVQTLIKRAELLGRMMVSPPVLDDIAARCDVAASDLSGLGRTTANVPLALVEPNSEHRASDIKASKAPYRLEVQGRPTVPIIDVYAQAGSVVTATCLADAAPAALASYLDRMAREQGVPRDQVVRLRPLGPARGGVIDGGATVTIAVLTFLTVFGLGLAALLGVERLSGRVRPAPLRRSTRDARVHADRGDAWPHTTRLLPWILAGFIALLWLTPFNNIILDVSAPIELRLDRLVLPVLGLVWILALATGGQVAPRLRMTAIHVALGAFLACAFLSVVTDARYLNHSLEFELSLKKLPLMVSYVSVFVITASSVRRAEVRPFMTYTLGLSVIVALGMIWEYRMKQNLFWEWSDKLLPAIFSIEGALPGGTVDDIGRRVVRGPAEVSLEAVAMLTMALPIALVRILHSRRWRDRLLYGVAVCALIAATFATYRKSGIIAPVSVVLTLAYFRRRELLRLAPLGMALLIIVSAISPGALGSTINQFTRSDAAAVPTVSDRSADYDAVRPDVWTHLVLGRGWGTYNHDSYRILDSEILHRTIETGVLGLIAFLMLGITVVLCSRRTIASSDPAAAPIALIGASIAVAFIVLAFLFDSLSFPHVAYIFLYMVGLETVILERRKAPPSLDEVDIGGSFREPEPVRVVAVQAPLTPAR